ncbi:BQ2448_7227 [Microbotryum intermedium]|uniref:BQ2448_7227 protein n=1 Tax=Microbotryum intermedium TaxID=269621 RepID=A0A238FMC1_9BASI|nr:BQ2448_7227 [Microbotryum intermedium]
MRGRSEQAKPLFKVFPSPFSIEDSQYSGGKTPVLAKPPYTLHEIEMKSLSYSIRSSKADWRTKRLSREIRTKWAIEALEQSAEKAQKLFEHLTLERRPMTFWMVDYVLDELEQHARVERIVDGQWRASCFDAIFESDRLIPDGLRSALIRQVAKLENVPDEQKDWHPGSRKQVLDLVHPSLYPLVYNQSVIRKTLDGDSHPGTTAASAVSLAEPPKPSSASATSGRSDDAETTAYLSSQYQWLPTDFTIDEHGGVTIDSYINNMHPDDHEDLYDTIAVIFSHFVPLFDQTLSELFEPRPRAIPVVESNWYGGQEFDMDEWMEAHKDEYDAEVLQDAAYEAAEDWEITRDINLPAPKGLFHPDPEEAIRQKIENLAFTIKGRTVQVIVKLANILLTPDQPKYEGGMWHVEGMKNESIVATGIYYYDQQNIADSSLAFRGTFDETELPYEQNDHRGVEIVFGIQGDGPTVQSYNSAGTIHNRCLTFPNIYQHRVPSFSLHDRTNPGHRKILVFFLIDPSRPRIPSTRDVAPQQREWIERALFSPDPDSEGEPNADKAQRAQASLINRLPNELWNRILDLTDGLMTWDEAKEHREKLMFERKFKLNEHSTEVYEREFSLCEH